MNDTNVQFDDLQSSASVLADLATGLEELTPEVRKAAAYVLEHPNDVGVSSIREIAEAAHVKPNTFVRMARTFGFEGYDDFREPFRDEIRRGVTTFPDRARWLQSLSRGGQFGKLYADMAASAISNIEETFASTDAAAIKAAADAIVQARQAFILGVGVNQALARNFAYIADMANNPGWQRGQQSCEWTSDPPLRLGSTYDQVASFLGKTIRSSFEVTEFEPGRRIRIVSTGGTMPIDVTREVESLESERCRVSARVRGQARGFMRLLGPLLDRMVQSSVRRDYARLRDILEEPPES